MGQPGFWNTPQLPENPEGGGWKCVCYPEEQGPVSFRALEGQHTIAQGEQESVELEPMEKAKELDRQNRIIHSGIRAEHEDGCTALKTLP